MWKNNVERGRPQMTIWCMRTACWVSKATNCVTLIALPLQQWLHERASMLRYTYIACLVFCVHVKGRVCSWRVIVRHPTSSKMYALCYFILIISHSLGIMTNMYWVWDMFYCCLQGLFEKFSASIYIYIYI